MQDKRDVKIVQGILVFIIFSAILLWFMPTINPSPKITELFNGLLIGAAALCVLWIFNALGWLRISDVEVAYAVVGTVIVASIALWQIPTVNQQSEPLEESLSNRIQPIGKVNLAQSTTITTAKAVEKETRSGDIIYNKHCKMCHASGAAGAPKFGVVADWQPRIGKGVAGLVKTATSGKGAMPPKGMCMDCSAEEIQATIEYMIKDIPMPTTETEADAKTVEAETKVEVKQAETKQETVKATVETEANAEVKKQAENKQEKAESEESVVKTDAKKADTKVEVEQTDTKQAKVQATVESDSKKVETAVETDTKQEKVDVESDTKQTEVTQTDTKKTL